MSLSQGGIGRREVGVSCNSFMEVDDSLPHRRIGPLVQGIHSFEIRVMRGNVERRARRRSVTTDPELVQDACGDVVLNGEDIRELTVEALRPYLVAVVGVHELRGDAYAIACLAYAALENRSYP